MQILTLDLNFQNIPHTIASYCIIGPGGPVLVETGPASTLPHLLARLGEHGYRPADIRHVLVTHIHLDHAGAAGWWAQQGAQVYVHPVGAPHLIDPSRLLASARRIYGDQMETLWGETVPAPAERVTVVQDGESIEVNGLAFTALDTPGHARHHHTYRLGDVSFVGDAAGVRILGSPYTDVTTPPPEFDLDAWETTLGRLRRQQFTAIYPTHFGRIDGVSDHLDAYDRLLHRAAGFVRERMAAGHDRDHILQEFIAWNRSRAADSGINLADYPQYETANPHYMTVDGMMRYWRKKLGMKN